MKQLSELSTELLARYKKGASKQATAADKAAPSGTKYANKRFSGIIKATRKQFDNDAKKYTKEETEQIDELSKSTLGRYVNKAANDTAKYGNATGSANERAYTAGTKGDTERKKVLDGYAKRYDDKITKRLSGIRKAVKRITAEEAEQIDELSQDTLKSYRDKSRVDMNQIDDAPAYGARERAIKRYIKGKRSTGILRANRKIKEETEQIDEISKDLRNRYIDRAVSSHGGANFASRVANTEAERSEFKKIADKRQKGISNAYKGMRSNLDKTNEEVEPINELKTRTLLYYSSKALKKAREHSIAAGRAAGERDDQKAFDHLRKSEKREQGYKRALGKIQQRSTQKKST